MEIKEIALPEHLKSTQLDNFFKELCNKIKELHIEADYTTVSKLLEVRITGSKVVHQLDMSGLMHLGIEVMGHKPLTGLTPANYLLGTYVLVDEPTALPSEDYAIHVHADENRVELHLPTRDKVYMLADFLSVDRLMLRRCILNYDESGERLTDKVVYSIHDSFKFEYSKKEDGVTVTVGPLETGV